MTLALRVLLGLGAGLLCGVVLSAAGAFGQTVVAVVTPIGAVFVNLIRMTAIPLIASTLIASLGGMHHGDGLGRRTARALVVSAGLVALIAGLSAVAAIFVFSRVPVSGIEGLAAVPFTNTNTATGSIGQWFSDLVPANVIRAAADGAVLPVIVFAVLVGVAVGRIDESGRRAVLGLAEGVAAVMQQIVGWVLALAPIGVFALAVPLATRLDVTAASAVGTYIALVVVLTIAIGVGLLYPLGIVGGRMSARAFAAYCAPGQAIGFASRSSLAALPAMMTSAEKAGLSPPASRLLLPLLVSVFHAGAAIQQTVAVVFLASITGVSLPAGTLLAVLVAVLLASYAVPSIPGGSIIALVPVLEVAGLPAAGVGVLLAIDTVPDMFRTTANLTGALALTAVFDRRRQPQPVL
jgi:proton glutamate symport protein